MVNLDTHVLVFALTDELTPRERRVLAGSTWGISAIVLWELAKLVQIRRIDLDLGSGEVTRVLSGLHTWPLDLAVAVQSTRLDFKGDPADEMIAATSVVHRVPLLTRDKVIRRSKVVPLA
jgi:PIN domain nuclease of toxin-antitoxin system